MRTFEGVHATGGRGYGICIRRDVSSTKEDTAEPPDIQVRRLEALSGKLPPGNGEIGEAMVVLWEDLLREMEERAETGEFSCAEEAVRRVCGELTAQLSQARQPYLRQRAQDFSDLCSEMLRKLTPRKAEASLAGAVLVTERLSVCQAMEAVRDGAAAVLTDQFSTLSHAAILLRGAGIPVAWALGNLNVFSNGVPVLVDGDAARVVLEPDENLLETAEAETLPEWPNSAVFLSDGTQFRLHLTCSGSWERLPPRAEVGLLRSEFFYTRLGRMPTVEELTEEYRMLAQRCSLLTVRLLDAGGDKPVAGISDAGENSALEPRGVRVLLKRREILRTQLTAVLRAAAEGRIRILIPMVTVPEEVEEVRAELETCARRLTAAGICHGEDIPVGVMIETPSAAILADRMAETADFAAVGTNDLMQYVMARSRSCGMLEPDSATLRLLHRCVEQFEAARKPLSVCGELASTPGGLAALVSAGIRCASVPAGAMAAARTILEGL